MQAHGSDPLAHVLVRGRHQRQRLDLKSILAKNDPEAVLAAFDFLHEQRSQRGQKQTYIRIHKAHHEVVQRLEVLRDQVLRLRQLFVREVQQARIREHTEPGVPRVKEGRLLLLDEHAHFANAREVVLDDARAQLLVTAVRFVFETTLAHQQLFEL